MSAAAFPYSESLLADQLGISRGRARKLRELHLEENLDWKKNGAQILLSKGGVGRISRFAGAPRFSGFEECLAGQKKNGAPKKMTVVPPMPLNPRMVLAEDEDGERWLVDVGKNTTFVFDDVIEVAPHDVQKGIWQLLSEVPRDRRRLPR